MPTVLRYGKYRFFFFSNENRESAHIHIESDNNYAKFWLNPVQLAQSFGYSSREIYALSKLVTENELLFNQKWHDYFN